MGERNTEEHMHLKGQFVYMEGGLVYIETETKTFFLPARHFMWIPPQLKHTIKTNSSEVLMRNLYFPILDDDAPFFHSPGIYPVNDLLLQMLMYTNKWNGNIQDDNKNAFYFAQAIKNVLPEICNFNVPLALPYPKNDRLKNVIDYLEKNLDKECALSQLATHFGFSERSLSRLFSKETGMSFSQYHTIQRMLKALQLLVEKKYQVNEVAYMVGYNSVPTFSNTFSQLLGTRPSNYLKESKLWKKV